MEKVKMLLLSFLIIIPMAGGAISTSASPETYENTIVLVTPSNTLLLNNVTSAFKTYAKGSLGVDVEIQLIKAGSPECMNRIIAWGGNPEADIFFGGDLIYHWKLKDKGLLEKYKPNSRYYDNLPLTFLGLNLKDPDETWHPKLWWGHGFMYNLQVLERLNLQVPKSWDELLDSKWKDLIVMCTPSRSSSTYINVALILQNRGWDQGWAFWRRIAANVGSFVPRSHDVIDLVSKGEYAVGFTYAQGVVINHAAGYPVSIYMDPTGFIASGVSLLKGAPHPNIAKAFLDWWYTPEAQEAALTAGAFPVIQEVKIDGPPGSAAAILKEYLGGKENIYEYLKTFTNVKFYNFTYAEAVYTDVSKLFDDNIVAKHSELKGAWSTILSVQPKVKGISEAEAKLDEAIKAFDKNEYYSANILALDAEKIATTPKGPSIMEIVLYAVPLIVIIGIIAFVFSKRASKK